MDERRLVDRQRVAHSFEIDLTDGTSAQSTDISRHGVGFMGEESVPVGDNIDLILMNRNVVIKGSVRHVTRISEKKYCIGVEFEHDEDDLVSVLLNT